MNNSTSIETTVVPVNSPSGNPHSDLDPYFDIQFRISSLLNSETANGGLVMTLHFVPGQKTDAMTIIGKQWLSPGLG